MIKLLLDYGADGDATSPRGWTPLSYCRAKGKYGAPGEKGIYPEVSTGTLSVQRSNSFHGTTDPRTIIHVKLPARYC